MWRISRTIPIRLVNHQADPDDLYLWLGDQQPSHFVAPGLFVNQRKLGGYGCKMSIAPQSWNLSLFWFCW